MLPEVLPPDVLLPVPVPGGEGPSPLVDPLLDDEIFLPQAPDVHEPVTLHVPPPLEQERLIMLPLAVPEQLRLDPSFAVPVSETLLPSRLPEIRVPFAQEISRPHDDDWVTVQLLSWHEPPTDHLPLKSLVQLPLPPPLLVLPPDVPLHAKTRQPRTTTLPTMIRFIPDDLRAVEVVRGPGGGSRHERMTPLRT